MNLLVGFYNDATPARTEEFIECLRRNVANSYLDWIWVFIEDPTPPPEEKAQCEIVLSHQEKPFGKAARGGTKS
jgi:hypothetical protein